MILNVNKYANVVLERSLRSNEGHIDVNESILTVMVMKQIWTQMHVCFLQMNSKRCSKSNENYTGVISNIKQKLTRCYVIFIFIFLITHSGTILTQLPTLITRQIRILISFIILRNQYN